MKKKDKSAILFIFKEFARMSKREQNLMIKKLEKYL